MTTAIALCRDLRALYDFKRRHPDLATMHHALPRESRDLAGLSWDSLIDVLPGWMDLLRSSGDVARGIRRLIDTADRRRVRLWMANPALGLYRGMAGLCYVTLEMAEQAARQDTTICIHRGIRVEPDCRAIGDFASITSRREVITLTARQCRDALEFFYRNLARLSSDQVPAARSDFLPTELLMRYRENMLTLPTYNPENRTIRTADGIKEEEAIRRAGRCPLCKGSGIQSIGVVSKMRYSVACDCATGRVIYGTSFCVIESSYPRSGRSTASHSRRGNVGSARRAIRWHDPAAIEKALADC